MSLKPSSSSYDSSRDEHLSLNRTIKTRTITFILAYMIVQLTSTTELHFQMLIKVLYILLNETYYMIIE